MKRNDIIRTVDGDTVRDNLDMIAKISSHKPGDKVRLTVFRDGRKVDLVVTLGDRKEALEAEFGRDATPPVRPQDEGPEESKGLGLTLENLDARTREQLGLDQDQDGVVITRVDFASEADDKGLRPTMVITAVNDEPIESVREWERAMEGLRSGSPVKLDIVFPGGEQFGFVFLRAPE
jgi:serine protease Do